MPRIAPGQRAIATFQDTRNPSAASQIVYVLLVGAARSVIAHRDGRVLTLDNASLS